MSFTANSTGGKYYSDVLNSSDKRYGLRSNEGPTYYTERTIVRSSDVGNGSGERNAKVSLVQPYITIYIYGEGPLNLGSSSPKENNYVRLHST